MPAPYAPPTDMIRRAEARLLARVTDLGDSERSPTDGAADEPTLHAPSRLAAGAAPREDGERYVFGEVFAAGGLGVVRRAEDRRLGRVIAVKELLRTSPEAQRRFALEAAITARLQHPGVVPLYDLGWRDGGEPYYCMKLVDGESLEAKIRGAGGLARRLALLEHVIAVADTIAYAHSRQIIHRDLKPANVLVGRFGEVVVIDWGLAKDLSGAVSSDMSDETSRRDPAAARSDMTEAGTIMGTLRYMAPEQARGEPVDVRSDIYSLGALLYHVLSGEPPFRGESAQLAARVMDGALADLRRLDPQIPRELAAVAHRAMAHDPAARYATADEFATDLRRFLAGRLVGAHSYSFTEVARRWIRRHRVVVGAAAISLAALSGAAIHAAGKERAAAAERARAEQAEQEAAALAEKASRAAFEREALARAQRLDASILRAIEMSDRSGHTPLSSARAIVREAQQSGGPVMAATRALTTALAAPQVEIGLGVARDQGFIRDALFAADAFITFSGQFSVTSWDLTNKRRPVTLPDISGVRVLPGGDVLTTSDSDGLAFRDPHTLAVRRTLPGARGTVVGLSADGRLLALIEERAPREYALHVWDLRREVEITTVTLESYCEHVAFSADGARMFTDYWQAQVWSLPDGRRLAQLSEPAYSNRGALSPDGRRAITTNLQDASLEIWDIEGKPRRLLRDPGLNNNTRDLIFTPDGKRLLVAGSYDALLVYDTEEGRLLRRIELGGGTFYHAALSQDGGLVAVGGEEGTVQVFEVDSGVLRARLRGEHGSTTALRFAPDGRRLVVGTSAGNADVWRIPEGVPSRWTIAGAPQAADIVPAADRLILADAAGAAVHRVSDGRELVRLHTDRPRRRAALTSDGALAMTRDDDGRVELWDAATGELRCAVAWPTRKEPWALFAFTADDAAVVLDDGDFAAHLWSTADCRAIATLREDWKTGLTPVDPRPELFVSGTRGGHSLIDARRLAPPVPLAPWPNMIEEATRTHDGSRVLMYGHANDGKTALAPLRLVDAATGATLADRPENIMRPFKLEFAPDDATFLAVTLGRVQLYSADKLVPLHSFDGLPAAPSIATFSPDGERVAVVDAKGAVGLWETRSGTFGGVLTHLRGRPLTLAFSDDGADLIVAGGTNGAVRVPATTDGLLAVADDR